MDLGVCCVLVLIAAWIFWCSIFVTLRCVGGIVFMFDDGCYGGCFGFLIVLDTSFGFGFVGVCLFN